eukprot:g1207.t1
MKIQYVVGSDRIQKVRRLRGGIFTYPRSSSIKKSAPHVTKRNTLRETTTKIVNVDDRVNKKRRSGGEKMVEFENAVKGKENEYKQNKIPDRSTIMSEKGHSQSPSPPSAPTPSPPSKVGFDYF